MEPAGKRVSARTPVDFESRRIEEPAIEQSFESDLVEWMDGLVYRNVGHVSLEPAWVEEMRWMKISIPTTTERPETEHSADPVDRVNSARLGTFTLYEHVIFQQIKKNRKQHSV